MSLAAAAGILCALCACGCREATSQDEVLFLGDSITEQASQRQGFIRRLERELPKSRLVNAGVSGSRSGDMLAHSERLLEGRHPRLVVVMIGINDVWHRGDGGFTQQHLGEFRANLDVLIPRLQGRSACVILCTTTTIGEDLDSPSNTALDDLNAAIREIAATRGAALAEVHKPFTKALRGGEAPGLTVDGVHLSPLGNALVAECLLPVLRQCLHGDRRAARGLPRVSP